MTPPPSPAPDTGAPGRADEAAPPDPADLATRRATPTGVVRWAFLAFGFLCVGVGMVGVVLPGLPTTVFMLLALWAFARSSRRFHDWLYHHPRFGPPLRNWTLYGVVPRRAKIAAIATMAASAALIGVVWRNLPLWMAATGIMTAVALWLASRPERAYAGEPGPAERPEDGS